MGLNENKKSDLDVEDRLLVEKLQHVIRGLQHDFEVDASFLVSPVKPLLVKVIDQILLASQLIDAGAPFLGKRNRGIRFLDSEKANKGGFESYKNQSDTWDAGEFLPSADSLGNPKQIRTNIRDPEFYSPQFARRLIDIASEISGKLRGFEDNLPYMGRSVKKKQSNLPKKQLSKESKYYFRRRSH